MSLIPHPHARSSAWRLSSRIACGALLVSTMFTSGSTCLGIDKITDTLAETTRQTVGILDAAIAELGRQSSQWQQVLEETRDKLTADAQSTVRNEVQNLLDRSIASTSGELRCDIDFIGARVRQALEHIKAKLLGQSLPTQEPALCNVVPAAVDMGLSAERRNKVELFGYDFDAMPIQVTLVNTNGTVDVTDKLSRTTHYHALLNLGQNGIPLNAQSQSIKLSWGGHDGSTISVIQPSLPVCVTEVVAPEPPNQLAFIPPHSGGDREFDGNGPQVNISVGVYTLNNEVRAIVNMQARETKSDWTTASGITWTTLYTADPGKRIDGIIGPVQDTFSYLDSDHAVDEFSRGNGPVAKYEFTGDTEDDEAGTETGVIISWNALRYLVSQEGNCVPASALFAAERDGTLGPGHEAQLRAIEPLREQLKSVKRLEKLDTPRRAPPTR